MLVNEEDPDLVEQPCIAVSDAWNSFPGISFPRGGERGGVFRILARTVELLLCLRGQHTRKNVVVCTMYIGAALGRPAKVGHRYRSPRSSVITALTSSTTIAVTTHPHVTEYSPPEKQLSCWGAFPVCCRTKVKSSLSSRLLNDVYWMRSARVGMCRRSFLYRVSIHIVRKRGWNIP